MTTGMHAEDEHGNDVTHMLRGGANLEAARAEYHQTAKRNDFFLQAELNAQQWATQGMSGPALLKSALFRTVSDLAILAAPGYSARIWP